MSITATLRPSGTPIKGAISNLGAQLQARTVALGSPVQLSDLTDVDMTAASDGAVLVFNGTTQKFVAQTTIENNNTRIVGGSF
jgi:hypothetical protein